MDFARRVDSCLVRIHGIIVLDASASSLASLTLVVHAGTTCFMGGLVALVHRVHYPMFARLGDGDAVRAYAAEHARRITPVVAPAMLLEGVTALAVLAWSWAGPLEGLRAWSTAGAVMLAAVWALTFFALVPLHAQIQRTGQAGLVASLVAWNRWRTLAWLCRAVISLVMVLALPTAAPSP